GLITWAKPVLAQGAQGGPNAPNQPMLGPYYQSFSGSDFHPYEDGLGSNLIKRAGYAVVRDSNFGIGVAGVRLPPGAVIVALTNDSAANQSGKTQLRLKRCKIFEDNCDELAVAEQNVQGRHAVTVSLNYAVDPQNESYFLQIDLPDDSGFYNGFIQYTLPS